MADLIVVFGVEIDRLEGEMAKTVIDLVRAGKSDIPKELLHKMHKLGYNQGLLLVAHVLTKEGYSDIPKLAVELIER